MYKFKIVNLNIKIIFKKISNDKAVTYSPDRKYKITHISNDKIVVNEMISSDDNIVAYRTDAINCIY